MAIGRVHGLSSDLAGSIAPVPWLSPGRHRWPRRGVCLMEYASMLSGGPRTDHPRTTDPVLAAIARAANDYSSDLGRQQLAGLAPALAAAHDGGDEASYAAARRCVLTALPHANGSRRLVLVAAVLGIDRAAAGRRRRGGLRESVTLDAEWALRDDEALVSRAVALYDAARVTRREHRRRGLPLALETAVATIAAHAPDPDRVLHRLLADCLDDYNGAVPWGATPARGIPASRPAGG